MSRKLASIVRIKSCDPIPDTERLSVATMEGKGWRVVTGRDEFKPGELAVYLEIDSFVDPTDERYAFLRDRCLKKFVSKSGAVLREGIRIKSIKLRGVVSQGLLMPLAKFPEITERMPNDYQICLAEEDNCIAPELLPVLDADVTALLKVEHYDEVKEQLQPSMGNALNADAMGNFPSKYIPKTDEERIQNLGDWFTTMKGRVWQISCKHDGTSCTIAYSPTIDSENPEIVCSRNLRLKPQTASGQVPIYWQMADKYKILEALKEHYDTTGEEIALQGEIVGPGINGDRNKETEYKFLVFRAWRVGEQQFFPPNALVTFCGILGIPHVAVIEYEFPFFDRITTMEDALKFAEGKTKEGNEREGVVCKTVDNGPYASFKIVSNKYLLSEKD